MFQILLFSVTAGEGHNATAHALASALEALGAQTRVLDAYRTSGRLMYHIIDKGYLLVSAYLGRGYGLFYRLLERRRGNSYRGSLSRLSGRSNAKKFKRAIEEFDPDVIWLHNIHGYYIHIGLLFAYLRTCGKKIIWTLHDCWAFTGHCAYFDFVQCEKWKTGCSECPQYKNTYPYALFKDASAKNYARKKEALRLKQLKKTQKNVKKRQPKLPFLNNNY